MKSLISLSPFVVFAIAGGPALFAAGDVPAQSNVPIPLWAGSVPGALGTDPVKDIPTLTPFRPAPDKATGAAMIICPGGGYGGLAAHEGKDYALWLNGQGVMCFVLKYRLGSNHYRHPAMLNDVNRAVRWVRFHADDWKINPGKIGVMGSSAGGHLASTAVTHYDGGITNAPDPVDRVSSRPDLGVLCYAVITMGGMTHGGSRNNLLGPTPSPDLIRLLSNELQVTRDTPPCFVWHTADDGGVPVANSIQFAEALSRNKVPFDLHIYQHGPHGLGLGVRGYDPDKTDPATLHPWTRDLIPWLKVQGFVR